ncbi:hypothetical protein ALI144C_06870 [Actinosynnema sp. ALI-1.44]|uniref:hypothetical protein n=1 Tax=Actinosynnema sp. ALI-1.44 TaxID=1933779 RepID=UPI00097BB684|nr:hypothetical protein [Actinosynnema sp. ALI-1.44]ONI88177.1 hypothetical protein ALI144C_06870 [Actinosynnema sp. ALI-1.44]
MLTRSRKGDDAHSPLAFALAGCSAFWPPRCDLLVRTELDLHYVSDLERGARPDRVPALRVRDTLF